MNSDVERVARAVCDVLYGKSADYIVWNDIGQVDREKCYQIAAAALRAIATKGDE